MENKFANLRPEKVFGFFDELLATPHGSGNEAAICDHLVDFADKRGLIAYRDELGNVTIIKPASAGMEEKETVILQAHTDMVCVAEEGTKIDFEKEPVDAYYDNGFIRAKGTSLGADDGIGVAMILAVLDDDTIMHPMIEAVFTTGEEIGLTGASGYDVSRLKGKRFINLDSEEEGRIVIGCAGGCRCDLSSKCKIKKAEGTVYEVSVSDLRGGHSGTDIVTGSANASIILGRLLMLANKTVEFSLASFSGGQKDNAIPSYAEATVVVKKKQGKTFEKFVKSYFDSVFKEYESTDPDMVIKCRDKGKGKSDVMSGKDMAKFLAVLNLLPNGVIKMSSKTDLVETSSNIGIAIAKPGSFLVTSGMRSSREDALEWIMEKAAVIARMLEITANFRDRYPAWQNKGVSEFAIKAQEAYGKVSGKKAELVTIHAGLECAVFASKIKDIDAISIGPDMYNVHSPKEKLSTESVERTWDYLLELLRL